RGAMVSNLGALAELIDENVNGCTVPAGDTQAWAERIGWCGEHLSVIQQWGQVARQRYEQSFTPEVNYQMLMEIYGRVLAG
ncbi:MAG: glycosyltransferase, partial [Cyanobacteria bacterium P01_A01_bin.105]